jgi:hypothetical protein
MEKIHMKLEILQKIFYKYFLNKIWKSKILFIIKMNKLINNKLKTLQSATYSQYLLISRIQNNQNKKNAII